MNDAIISAGRRARATSTAAMLTLLMGAGCGGMQGPNTTTGAYVKVSLALVPSSVVKVTATVTGPGISTPIQQDLTIAGNPPSAVGTIPNVPVGSNRTVTVAGYPAAPEQSTVIYRGSAVTQVVAGQTANVSISLLPVNADVAVTAQFPAGDQIVAQVDHTAVAVSGTRIEQSITYYLALNTAADHATGTASSIPVGATRTFSVSAYDASGKLLFSGSAVAAVVEGGSSVTVTLTDQTSGSVSVNGGFCTPQCTGKVCGSDGCSGSCGGCRPGIACVAGACTGIGTYNYQVLAGNGTQGFSGDNGPATSAQLAMYAAGVAKDAAGNLYIGDAGNARVRKVDVHGIISTFAGNGVNGSSGNGGPATSAELNAAAGIAVDASGNVYIAEFNGNDIRVVTPAGTINQYVALPSKPTGLSIDAAGNLYVAMFSLDEIIRVDTQRHQTVVAGNGQAGYSGDGGLATSARLSNPNGVWADGSGNLYIDDSNNFVIRKVNTSGVITTVAGNGTPGYSGDNGAATKAQISSLYGITVNGAGEIFLSDTANNVIRMVDTQGIIHTIAGNGSHAFTAASGPALQVGLNGPGYSWMDPQGNLYFTDNNTSVYEVSPAP